LILLESLGSTTRRGTNRGPLAEKDRDVHNEAAVRIELTYGALQAPA
jgi:hypothetical protein